MFPVALRKREAAKDGWEQIASGEPRSGAHIYEQNERGSLLNDLTFVNIGLNNQD